MKTSALCFLLASTMLVACGADEETPGAPVAVSEPTTPPPSAAPADPASSAPVDPAGAPAAAAGEATPAAPAATPVDPASADPMAPPSSVPPPAADPFAGTPAGGFGPTVTPVGTFAFAGFSQSFAVPLGTSAVTRFVLSAPASCAPRLVQAYVTTAPFGVLVPVWFEGQRLVSSTLEAVLRVGNGYPVVATSLTLGFTSATGASCPITIARVN